MDEYTKSRYYMILSRYLLMVLEIDFFKHVITWGDGPYKGCTDPMLYLIHYYLIPLNINDITRDTFVVKCKVRPPY